MEATEVQILARLSEQRSATTRTHVRAKKTITLLGGWCSGLSSEPWGFGTEVQILYRPFNTVINHTTSLTTGAARRAWVSHAPTS